MNQQRTVIPGIFLDPYQKPNLKDPRGPGPALARNDSIVYPRESLREKRTVEAYVFVMGVVLWIDSGNETIVGRSPRLGSCAYRGYSSVLRWVKGIWFSWVVDGLYRYELRALRNIACTLTR